MGKLIGISGKIGSGKDTFAIILQCITAINKKHVSGSVEDIKAVLNQIETDDKPWGEIAYPEVRVRKSPPMSKWKVKKFAGKLKEIASILTGVPVEKFEDQEFKKQYMPPEYGMTYR